MAIDYDVALAIINSAPDPVDAFTSFVAQEREHAAHEALSSVATVVPAEQYARLTADD